MATEQLKYDFELNLARAERNIDRFVTSIETRFDRVSSRMERAFEKISRGAGGGGGRSGGGGGSSIERQADRVIRRQSSAQREIARQQKQQARELAADKAKFDREEAKRIRDRDRDRTAKLKRLERDENSRTHVIDRFEQSRRTRRESLDNITKRAELRSRGAVDRIDFGIEDDKAYGKALQARKRYIDTVQNLMKASSWKTMATVRTEVAQLEAQFKGALARLTPERAKAAVAGVPMGAMRGGRSGRASAMLFQGQQMIEDYNFAGWRGVSNNLAFMGSMMRGPAGIAVVAGVAAKGVYDLYQSFKQAGSGAGEMADQFAMASTRLERFASARQQFRQEALDFSVPTNRRELDQRDAELRFRRQRAGNTAGMEADERNLALLQQMKQLRQDATDSMWWKSMGSWAPGPVVDKFVSKMGRFEDLKRQLSDPGVAADPDKIGDEIGRIQQRIAARKDEIATERDSIAMEERRLINNLQVVDALENAARKQDRLTTGLERQLDIERQLVEATKRRAESIQDAAYGRGEAFGGRAFDAQGSILARQWQTRTERAQQRDRITQTMEFRRRFGADPSNHALGGHFSQWLSRRQELIGKKGEQLEDKAQYDLAKQRAEMLKQRGEEQLAQAQRFAEKGNIGRAGDFFDRARGSFSSVQDLQMQWASRGTDPMKQQKFLDEAKATEGWIGGIDKAELAANEKASAQAQGKISVLDSMSKSVEELAARAERLQIFKETDMAKARSLNGALDGMIRRLERIQGLSSGPIGSAGVGAPTGPRLPGRASGGPVSRSSPYLVGERGMEVFVPTVPGQIVNATDTRRMLSRARDAVAPVTNSTTSYTSSLSIGTINAATVDVRELQRSADWREKARKARMGN
ncbi:hypothetical protein Pan44_28300 [Caulifigura coniformis]|uniref:Uncharacterized protein n=1 Tax=Caulifigura coniformis TaxID=2527983 RepID=A0A517SF91_9PLAN|nr:hypothetical protein [Caulifigura coniformis]QDT54792.1 hypothetical protein Pan44_28300 [Caulifigura coniformis]